MFVKTEVLESELAKVLGRFAEPYVPARGWGASPPLSFHAQPDRAADNRGNVPEWSHLLAEIARARVVRGIPWEVPVSGGLSWGSSPRSARPFINHSGSGREVMHSLWERDDAGASPVPSIRELRAYS